jgi:hypothetical protein
MNEERKSMFEIMNNEFGGLSDEDSEKWREKLDELILWLTGNKIEGLRAKHQKVSFPTAKTIVWFLQEMTGIVPDQFEVCVRCGCVYDSHREGHWSDVKNKGYCGSCLDYHLHFCEYCVKEVSEKKYSKKHEAYLCTECRKERGKAGL